MIFETLLYELDTLAKDKEGNWIEADTLAVITINRPDKLNALNETVIRELDEAIAKANTDETVKGIILTGAGEKSFVAGADIRAFQELDKESAHSLAQTGQAVFTRIEESRKPVIGAVNGYALGGGCELALACHLRTASENALFGQPEVNLGLIPGYGGTQRLPHVVGLGIATEMILTGTPIAAQRAFEIGLVNHITTQDKLLETTKKLLRTITNKAPVAVQLAHKAVRASQLPLEDGLALEASLFAQTFDTEDVREGVDAFLNKRKPKFKGC